MSSSNGYNSFTQLGESTYVVWQHYRGKHVVDFNCTDNPTLETLRGPLQLADSRDRGAALVDYLVGEYHRGCIESAPYFEEVRDFSWIKVMPSGARAERYTLCFVFHTYAGMWEGYLKKQCETLAPSPSYWNVLQGKVTAEGVLLPPKQGDDGATATVYVAGFWRANPALEEKRIGWLSSGE